MDLTRIRTGELETRTDDLLGAIRISGIFDPWDVLELKNMHLSGLVWSVIPLVLKSAGESPDLPSENGCIEQDGSTSSG